MRSLVLCGQSGAISQHLHPSQLPVACWAVWALVSLWAALDSSRLWRVLGRRVDPLGPQALYGVLPGALNIGASLLVVMSRTSREVRRHPSGSRENFTMKAPEFNIALSRVGEVVTYAGDSARELPAATFTPSSDRRQRRTKRGSTCLVLTEQKSG